MVTPNELIPILVALILVGLINRALLLERLRNRHHDVWVAMGMPTSFGSRKGSHELLRFMGVRGEFQRLNDAVLTAFVYVHRFVIVAAVLTFAGVILLAMMGQK